MSSTSFLFIVRLYHGKAILIASFTNSLVYITLLLIGQQYLFFLNFFEGFLLD